MNSIDQIRLNFSAESLLLLNFLLAFMLFGVALELRLWHFKYVWQNPRGVLVGCLAQFIWLPFATYLLVRWLQPTPSIALGMMLIAACPGGNVSNFITSMAKGNTALSVSLSAVTAVFSIALTPLNFAFYGDLYEPTRQLLRTIAIDPVDMLRAVGILLALPLALGLYVAERFPAITAKIYQPIRKASMVLFGLFVVAAFAANFRFFIDYIHVVVFVVLVQNTCGFAGGYGLARLAGVPPYDARAVAIESGIQNSGFGLVLIFTFFGGLGGMAITAAWWGIWHLVAGGGLAWYWSKTPSQPISTDLKTQ